MGRIYPLWLTAHALIAVPLVVLGRISVGVAVASAIGIRFLPQTYFAIVPAWWYVGLLLQLYAIVPILWWVARKYGAARMMLGAMALGLVVRAAGWNFAGNYIDEWSRGAIFVTRLPEFAFGVGLAMICRAQTEHFLAFIRAPRMLTIAILSLLLGTLASMTSAGMIFAPLLTSCGGFVVLCAAMSYVRNPALEWIGRHSYSLYVAHQATMIAFINYPASPVRAAIEVGVAAASGVALALALEWLAPVLERTLRGLGVRRGAALAACACALLFAGEGSVRAFDPQEAYGAGERPSLVSDPLVAYKLKPNSSTHLRWLTYDYVVDANSLGFPAPEPPVRKPDVTTVMSLGTHLPAPKASARRILGRAGSSGKNRISP